MAIWSQPRVMGERVMAEPRRPRRAPRRVWMKSLEERKERIGRYEISDLRSRLADGDGLPRRFTPRNDESNNSCSLLARTEVRRPPWRARQVRPPVVRPVRKMTKRFVFCIN